MTFENILRKIRKSKTFPTRIVVSKKIVLNKENCSAKEMYRLKEHEDAYPIGIFSSMESAFNAVMHTVETEHEKDPKVVRYWADLTGRTIDIYFFDDEIKLTKCRGALRLPSKRIIYKLYPTTDLTNLYFENDSWYGYKHFLKWRKNPDATTLD